jgi:predicted transcriptional regulator
MVDRDPPATDDRSAADASGTFIVPEEHRGAILEGLRQADRGEFASEEEMAALWKKCGLKTRHREERSDEAIYLSACCGMDCFAEPVIGPRFARTRWLAMTAGYCFTPSHHAHVPDISL